MKFITRVAVLMISVVLVLPECVFARGRGGGGGGGGRIGGGGGGGGGAHLGGGGGGLGGGGHANFGGGGGGGRPNVGGGGGGGLGGGGGHPNFGGGGGLSGGGGSRPNIGNLPNHSPSFSHPTGGGSARPDFGGGFGGGNRPEIGGGNFNGGNRPNIGGGGNRPEIGGGNFNGGNRPNIGGGGNRPNIGGGGNRPNLNGGGNRPEIGNRPNIGNGGIGNNTNIGNRTNIGHIGNNNFNNFNNVHNNINIASNRPYYNNWQHGNWNGNWNRPGGGGYWSGYAHGYQRGYMNGGWGGYWHGGAGGYGYWGRPWYSNPIAWGLGAWAVGSIMYNSGYASYSNPYYSGGANTSAYYDYSQPIIVNNQQPSGYDTGQVANIDPNTVTDNTPAPTPVPPEVQAGTSHMDAARDAFKNGDYAAATREIDVAIQSLPKDAALHEFRALVFFATKDYKQAAATLYAVLSAGPGWDWTTLSGMYASSATYTDQLRDLEQYVKSNPSSADAHFVLAYHYLTCGHNDAAIKQYQDVAKLQPGDQLTTQLLKMLDADAPATADSSVPPPAAPETDPVAPTAIDATKIVGNWTAKRPNGPTFSLNLTNDSKFTWGYEQGSQHETFGGKYSVDGAILVLERTDGAQMPGLVTLASNGFNFKLYGGPPDDSGLDFTK